MKLNFSKLREVYKKSITGDGIGNILFYRPLATVCTAIFVLGNFSANAVTFLSLLSNIASAYFFLSSDFFLGMIFFHFGNILDCSDGQVAQYTNTKTFFGKCFDAWVDRISYIFIFGSIITEYIMKTGNFYFLYIYIFWLLIFFSNTYFAKIALEISEQKGLKIIQEKSQKVFGKFSRYIRWDGTITALIFHICLFFEHLEWIVIIFLVWHGILMNMTARGIVRKSIAI